MKTKQRVLSGLFVFMGLLLIFAVTGFAESSDSNLSWGAGYSITEYTDAFGLNLNFLSPAFFENSVQIKLDANVNWLNALYQNGIETKYNWFPYFSGSLEVIGGGFINPFIRLYGFGGIYFLIGNKDITTLDYKIGGIGGFGFEFFFNNKEVKTSYFIEIGGCGIKAIADKLLYSPLISNGFVISAGFRFYF